MNFEFETGHTLQIITLQAKHVFIYLFIFVFFHEY